MSDVSQRADDYERRLTSAGSTHALVAGLVRSIERGKRVVAWLAVSLVLNVTVMLLLTVLFLYNDHRTSVATTRACDQSVENSLVVNQFLDALIANVNRTSTYTAAEKATRVASYEALRISIPDC